MVATWPSDHRQVWASLQGLLNLAQRNRQHALGTRALEDAFADARSANGAVQ